MNLQTGCGNCVYVMHIVFVERMICVKNDSGTRPVKQFHHFIGGSAKTKARQAAMAAIREFAGEQVAVATDTLNAETAEEFEGGAETYSNESAMKEKIKAAAGRMNIAGIAPLRNVKCKHPLNGKTVFVCAVTWCPKQAGQARQLKASMARPPAAPVAGARPAAVPAAQAPTGPLNSQGQGADEDAF